MLLLELFAFSGCDTILERNGWMVHAAGGKCSRSKGAGPGGEGFQKGQIFVFIAPKIAVLL